MIQSASKKSKWKDVAVTIGSVLAYMVPLFWLWQKSGFPEDFGVHITAHGEVGLLENWYYSYLLIERHRPVDLIAFAYMWGAIVALGIYLFPVTRKDREAERGDVHPKIDTE